MFSEVFPVIMTAAELFLGHCLCTLGYRGQSLFGLELLLINTYDSQHLIGQHRTVGWFFWFCHKRTQKLPNTKCDGSTHRCRHLPASAFSLGSASFAKQIYLHSCHKTKLIVFICSVPKDTHLTGNHQSCKVFRSTDGVDCGSKHFFYHQSLIMLIPPGFSRTQQRGKCKSGL